MSTYNVLYYSNNCEGSKLLISMLNSENLITENINETEKNAIDRSLILLLIKDNFSLRIVESKYFIDYTNLLKKNYKLPNRKQLRDNIDKLYLESTEKMISLINKNNSNFSISTDIWKANTNKSYLGLKLHYIDDEFVLKTYTIAFKYISESHTGENIYNIITETLKKFNIGKIQSFTSDNCSNNLACVKFLKNTFPDIAFVGCFAHIINLIVQSGTLKDNPLIIKVRKIVNDVNGVLCNEHLRDKK